MAERWAKPVPGCVGVGGVGGVGASVAWEAWTDIVLPGDTAQVKDVAGNPQRFYRVQTR